MLVVVAIVPVLRHLATRAATRTVLFAAAPLAPDVGDLDRLPQSTKVVAADGTLLATLDAGERRDPLRIGDLPDHVRHATLAAEDERFYQHPAST